MFSGHATTLMVMLLYWLTRQGPYTTLVQYLRQLTIVCFLAGVLAIIGNRAHYTVDIVVAIYTVMGIWWSHSYFWRLYVVDKGDLPGLTFNYRAFWASQDYLKV